MAYRFDLRAALNRHFQNQNYYKDIDFNDSLQDGLDEIVPFTGCVYGSVGLPFTANTTYYDLLTLIPNYSGVIAIFNNTIKRFLIPTSITKLDQDRIDWECAAGTPYYFCPVNFRYVAIYKKPISANYGNMFVYYKATAPTLDDSTLIPIPDDHVYALEAYSTCDMLEQNQEFSKASKLLEAYISNLNDLKRYMNKRDPDLIRGLRG